MSSNFIHLLADKPWLGVKPLLVMARIRFYIVINMSRGILKHRCGEFYATVAFLKLQKAFKRAWHDSVESGSDKVGRSVCVGGQINVDMAPGVCSWFLPWLRHAGTGWSSGLLRSDRGDDTEIRQVEWGRLLLLQWQLPTGNVSPPERHTSSNRPGWAKNEVSITYLYLAAGFLKLTGKKSVVWCAGGEYPSQPCFKGVLYLSFLLRLYS